MKPYGSSNAKETGVLAYKTGKESITVRFKEASFLYVYTYASAGKQAVDTMKMLAKAQAGLSTFISRVHPPYESKIAVAE